MNKFINTLFVRSAICLQILLLGSCHLFNDDMSQCDLFLKFRYDYNLAYEDWFGQHVPEIKVFIFDTEGRYVQTFQENTSALAASDYRMKIPYQMKGYTAIVWAGKTDPDYRLPQLKVGDPIEKLTLHYEPNNHNSARKIASLWHSAAHKMEFPEAYGTEQTLSLVRNTNDINVAIQINNTPAATSDYLISIKGANGSYDFQNHLLSGIEEITYCPTEDSPILAANLYILRMVQGAQMNIAIQEKSTGKQISVEGKTEADLTEFLLKSKPNGMPAQEYLDRRYNWDITLNYDAKNYLAISITINGWTHWFHNTDI